VITDGGDQPNVVPSRASVWYYFRELDYDHIKELFEIGNISAEAAAKMTNTEVEWRILGSAWPRHFNKVIAETMYENIKTIGLPEWSDADQELAKALQKELGADSIGLATELSALGEPPTGVRTGGGSDDIGDISWNVPTVTLRFPSNFRTGGGGHHWSSAVAMATPIAHKGATAGAKVMALTALDFLLQPQKVEASWAYFNDVQTKGQEYVSFISADDRPAIHLNEGIMEEFREEMRNYYFDPTQYDTYLEQLGIEYPTVRDPS
jgi:aminobenzoyl-glutamate utilization protein B